jgi:metal-responsive CopG/Arc/MetJ family transcriptional regulator
MIPPELLAALDTRAAAEGATRSDLIRALLWQALQTSNST